MSRRKRVRRSMWCSQAFPWTLALAGITMGLVLVGAIVLGSLAALHVGGFFDRLSSIISLAAASAPDFWVAIDGDLRLRRGPRLAADLGDRQRMALDPAGGVLFVRPFGLILQVVRGSMITALSRPT